MANKIQLVVISAICTVVSGCDGAEPVKLGTCWNINEAKVGGRVSGTGVFVNSRMHGFALVAPNCDDRAGSNRYELDANADSEFRRVSGMPSNDHADFLRFQFEGAVRSDSRGKVLIISNIWAVEPTSEPNWRIEIRRRYRR
ncbi:MAG: hypothetical protein GXC70_03950 [Sphingomonadaceae bacterium]|nr:hypothetical protein [Sphingomonadaceae bacterium]